MLESYHYFIKQIGMGVKFLAIIVFALVIYFNLYPFDIYGEYKKYIHENEPLMRITVMIFSSIVTVLAMFVALFKEDIRGFFVKPKLNISENNQLNEEKQKTDSSDTIEALHYYYKVFISNIGNIPAKEVEVYLTSFKYKKVNDHNYREIEIDMIPLSWKNSESKQIILPRNSKKSLTLFKLLPPSETSTPDKPVQAVLNKIQIGTHDYCVDNEQGEWLIVFSIYSDNARPMNIHLTISWNGKWEKRLSEMNTHFQVKEEIKYD